MKLARLILCFLLVLGTTLPPVFAARPTIAVRDFTMVGKAVALGNGFSMYVWDEKQTNLLTSDFITQLVQTRKFDVVERDRMNEIIKEQDFSDTEYVSTANAIKMGQLLGADYFIFGQIELIEAQKTSKQVPYTDKVSESIFGRMVVNMRIVDTRGGKVVAAKKINYTDSGKMTGSEAETAMMFMEKLKENTVKKLVNEVVEGVFPIKVASISGTDVVLNRGEGASYSAGDVLTVYEQGKDIKDPDTGESLGAEEIEIGKIQVTEILQKQTKGTLISGDPSAIKVGAICRSDSVKRYDDRPEKPESPGSSAKPIQW
ncbi:hypothetical protein JW979_16425 [bacterium]|nr:hypothetical protein [candidate division CSSED10-310 bacterium]